MTFQFTKENIEGLAAKFMKPQNIYLEIPLIIVKGVFGTALRWFNIYLSLVGVLFTILVWDDAIHLYTAEVVFEIWQGATSWVGFNIVASCTLILDMFVVVFSGRHPLSEALFGIFEAVKRHINVGRG